METHDVLPGAGSRRTFFRAAGVSLLGGSAVFLSACGTDAPKASSGPPNGTGGDVDILNSALDLENMSIFTYTAATRILRGEALATAKLFLGQEHVHADGIARAIRRRGGTPNGPKASYDIGTPRSPLAVLKLAERIENVAVAAYIEAIPKLADPELRATAAAIATNQAEHIVVLRRALGRRTVPTAFVTGSGASA